MSELKCNWCKGAGKLSLKSRGIIECLNCKGSGKGVDGGNVITNRPKPWMVDNKHARKTSI